MSNAVQLHLIYSRKTTKELEQTFTISKQKKYVISHVKQKRVSPVNCSLILINVAGLVSKKRLKWLAKKKKKKNFLCWDLPSQGASFALHALYKCLSITCPEKHVLASIRNYSFANSPSLVNSK